MNYKNLVNCFFALQIIAGIAGLFISFFSPFAAPLFNALLCVGSLIHIVLSIGVYVSIICNYQK